MTKEEYIKKQIAVDNTTTRQEKIDELTSLNNNITIVQAEQHTDHELDIMNRIMRDLKKNRAIEVKLY